MRVGVIIVAAGQGTRLGEALPKAFVDLGGKPMFLHAACVLVETPGVCAALVAVPAGTEERANSLLGSLSSSTVSVRAVAGGAERQDSVARALEALPPACELVVVHDAARPFVQPVVVAKCIETAVEHGAAIAVGTVTDTIKEVDTSGVVSSTLDRSRLVSVQTPQVFRREVLESAYERARRDGVYATDDAALVERNGGRVWTVRSDATNLKITTPADLAWARWYVARPEASR